MISLSKRHALPLVGLLAAALLGVTVNGGSRRTYEDCADPMALRDPDFFASETPFHEEPEENAPPTSMWMRGRVATGVKSMRTMEVMVVRTFDPISLYLEPEYISSMPASPDTGDFQWVEAGDTQLPMHSLYVTAANRVSWRTWFTTYLYVYRNEPVRRPFLAQLAGSVGDSWRGRPPLTIFLAKASVSTLDLEAAEQASREWIVEAWKRYDAVCNPPSPASE